MDPIAVDLPAAPKPAAPKPDAAAAKPFGLLGALTSFSRKQAVGACVAALSLGAGVAVVKYSTPAAPEKAAEKQPPPETAKAPPKADPPAVPFGPPGVGPSSPGVSMLPFNSQLPAGPAPIVPSTAPTAMPLPATLPAPVVTPEFGPSPPSFAPRVLPDVAPVVPPLPAVPPLTPADYRNPPSGYPAPPVVPAVPPATLPPLPLVVVPISGIDGKTVPPPAAPQAPAALPQPPGLPAAPAKVDLPPLPSVAPSALPAAPLLPSAPSVVPPTAPAVVPTLPTAPPQVPTAPAVAPVPPATVFGPPVTPRPPAVVPDLPAALPTPPGFSPAPALPPTPPALVPTPPAFTPTPPALVPTVTPAAGVRAPQTSFDVDMHEPRAGDTYESISKSFYNDARYGGALAAYNQSRPLTAGRAVDVPPVHVLRQRHGQLVGGTTAAATDPTPTFRPGGKRYVVPAGGMSLGTVAQRTLGSQARWREIYDLNPGVASPELVAAGTDLRLPPDATVP